VAFFYVLWYNIDGGSMLVHFKCNNPDCPNEITKLFSKSKDISSWLDCGECGVGKLERQLSAPSTKSTQMIDNGAQARRVEVMSEVVLKESERLAREEEEND
jgi:hypothetical protein